MTVTTGRDPVEHGHAVASMFGRIARFYDLLNRALSLGQDVYWRYRMVRLLRFAPDNPCPLVLDLAAGTLDVSLEILRQHATSRVVALDFSLPMLKAGGPKIKPKDAGRIVRGLADGRELPLPDNSVDGATIAFGIRNIIPRERAFQEVFRVLKPGSRFIVLEFGSGRQRIWKGLYNRYLQRVLPAIGRIVSGDSGAYTYLAETITAFPTARELTRELVSEGFERVTFIPLLSGIVYIHLAEKAGGVSRA